MTDVKKVLAVKEELGPDYQTLEETTQAQIEIVAGPGGIAPLQTSQGARGWRLRDVDGAWTVALLPDSFSLESSGYTSWSGFRQRLDRLVAAVERHMGPAAEFRLGVRYVDRVMFDEVDGPAAWCGFINDRLLGPLLDERLGPGVRATQQLLHLVGPDGITVLLRHGTDNDGTDNWPYVLDTDCFRTGSRVFSSADVMKGAEDLHRLALQIFEAAVTERLIEQLKT